jgi:ribose transport system permease protein
MAVSAVIGCSFMAQTGNLVVGTILILVIAGLFGMVNGIATAYLGMVPLIVTLSMMTICQGIATSIAGGESILGLSPAFSIFFDKPKVIIIFIIIAFLLDTLLRRTIFGRRLYYIGTNKNTALVSGIPTKITTMLAYVISGLCAGIAGVFNTAALSTARAAMGPETQILDVISAAVIGGVSIKGGKGTIVGAALGAILIIVVSNVMNLLGVSDYYTNMVKGSIIIIAMAFNAISDRYNSA